MVKPLGVLLSVFLSWFLVASCSFAETSLSKASPAAQSQSEIVIPEEDVSPFEPQQPGSEAPLPPVHGYLARLYENSPDGLQNALQRAEMLFMEGRLKGELPPASFVLHGPEVAVFFRENYQTHKGLVDLAARLSAFGVISIQVCETRTGVLGRDRSDLLPFVGTVPFGPAEEQRLVQKERYVYF